MIESRSITQELGFSHKFYMSNTHTEKYNQKLSSSDVISSITLKELRNIKQSTEQELSNNPNTIIFQAFNRLFFDTNPGSELLSTNLISIEPFFVNDYPFKRGENGILEIFSRVSGTLIYYYGILLEANNYFILPFKTSFFNFFFKKYWFK